MSELARRAREVPIRAPDVGRLNRATCLGASGSGPGGHDGSGSVRRDIEAAHQEGQWRDDDNSRGPKRGSR